MFSKQEYERRYLMVQSAMVERGVDCLIIPTNESLTYLCGIRTIGYGAYLLVSYAGEATLFCSPIAHWDEQKNGPLAGTVYTGGELAQTLLDTSYVTDIRGVLPQDFMSEIQAWCLQRTRQEKTIGIVGREFDFPRGGGGLIGMTGPAGLSHVLYSQLSELLGEAGLLDATDILLEARSIKSVEEIESHRDAAVLADLCKDSIENELTKTNVTEADLFAVYWDTVYRNGGCGSWWFMVGSTATAAPQLGHFRDEPKDYRIQIGDCVIAEIMPVSNEGYAGHSEASFLIGDYEQSAIYDKVNAVSLESLNRVIDCLRPGVKCNEVVDNADEPIVSAGFKRSAPLAYGLGQFGLQPPFMGAVGPIEEAGADVLIEGMVMCVISHVIDPKSRVSIRTGSTQLITHDGTESLNKYTDFGMTHIER